MDLIVSNLRGMRVYIPESYLVPNSKILSDYDVVWTKKFKYSNEEGVDVPSNCPPASAYYLDLTLHRPFCTEGCYTMSLSRFCRNPCYFMHSDHDQRFSGTKTINLTSLKERELHDTAWIKSRTALDQTKEVETPAHFAIASIPGLLSQKDVHNIMSQHKEKRASEKLNSVGVTRNILSLHDAQVEAEELRR